MTTIPSESYQIKLLRHAESVGNAGGYYQGQADFPLTEAGKAQAQALAERWVAEKIAFDLVISSPLSRARQTAEIITRALNAPLELEALWMEWNNGRLAGLKAEEVAEKYPRPAFINPFTRLGETGESQWDLYVRAGQALKKLMEKPAGSYLVVSHGGFLNMVMYTILGITPQANFYGPRFRFFNCAFASLTYIPNEHRWYVEGVNDHLHWPEPGENGLN